MLLEERHCPIGSNSQAFQKGSQHDVGAFLEGQEHTKINQQSRKEIFLVSLTPKPLYEISKNRLSVYPHPAPMRLDKFFRLCLPKLSYAALQKYIRKGHIRLKKEKAKPMTLLEYGDEISLSQLLTEAFSTLQQKRLTSEVPDFILGSSDVEMFRERILYEDADILVWNKPSGLAVQGGTRTHKHLDGFLGALMKEGFFDTQERPRLVHRLDKDTSGLLLIAKTLSMATYLMKAFQDQRIKKEYLALVEGNFPESEGIIDLPLSKKENQGTEKVVIDPLMGRKAVSLYKTLDSYHDSETPVSFMSLSPQTGRTHQLRVHCSALKAPIVGDRKYGAKGLKGFSKKTPLCLHAYGITFPLASGIEKTIYAPVPDSFLMALHPFDFQRSWEAYHQTKTKK